MRKRVLSFLLAVTLMVSLLPVSAMAAADADFEAQVKSAVSQMLKAYAKKVDQPNADDRLLTITLSMPFSETAKR